MSEKNDLMFIEHILDSINAIRDFSKNMNKDEFIKNRLKKVQLFGKLKL